MQDKRESGHQGMQDQREGRDVQNMREGRASSYLDMREGRGWLPGHAGSEGGKGEWLPGHAEHEGGEGSGYLGM